MGLSNPALWQLVYLQNFTAEYFDFLQLPIVTFDTPPISQHIIRLKVSSTESRPSWVRAGNASQIVNAGNVSSSIKNLSLILNQDRVVFLEPFTPYFLRFALPKYFTQATVSIFGYTGNI
jgi:hypothetical protein